MNRRHRLRSRAAFRAVREQRVATSSDSLRVAVAANGGSIARVGFAIPRAVGSAVVRNRLRRRLREGLRPRLEGLAGLDVVVSARPQAAALGGSELAADVRRCTEMAARRLAGDAGSGRPARP